MLPELKQFVLSEKCLACEGCCRFYEEKSFWRPRVSSDEKDRISDSVDEDQCVKTSSSGGMYICGFFNCAKNGCDIYEDRPLECKLYPFLLSKQKDGLFLCAHLSCPEMQESQGTKEREEYVSYLKDYFAIPEVVGFLKNNPSLLEDYTEYKDELEYLFPVFLGDDK